MEVVSTEDVETVEAIDDVFLSQLASGERMSVQRYRIDPGAVVDTHSHHHEQVGYLCSGALTFVTEDGEEYTVEAGSAFAVPGDEPHRAENRGDEPAVGVDVFSPPRPNPPWLDDAGADDE